MNSQDMYREHCAESLKAIGRSDDQARYEALALYPPRLVFSAMTWHEVNSRFREALSLAEAECTDPACPVWH